MRSDRQTENGISENLSSPKIFGKMLSIVKNTRGEKVGKVSNSVEDGYVNQNEFEI